MQHSVQYYVNFSFSIKLLTLPTRCFASRQKKLRIASLILPLFQHAFIRIPHNQVSVQLRALISTRVHKVAQQQHAKRDGSNLSCPTRSLKSMPAIIFCVISLFCTQFKLFLCQIVMYIILAYAIHSNYRGAVSSRMMRAWKCFNPFDKSPSPT